MTKCIIKFLKCDCENCKCDEECKCEGCNCEQGVCEAECECCKD